MSWNRTESADRELQGRALSGIEVESFVRGVEAEKRSATRELMSTQADRRGPRLEDPTQAALAIQEHRENRFARREQMRTEIKRGRELLEQVQNELAALRSRLEEWPGYETVCGKNPLCDYMQTIAAKERIEQYLPVWLKRREEELHSLNREIEYGASQAGG